MNKPRLLELEPGLGVEVVQFVAREFLGGGHGAGSKSMPMLMSSGKAVITDN